MKKFPYIVFISAFFIISFLPAALMGIYDGGLSENRVISRLPSIKMEDGRFNTGYFEALSTYVSEHFAFRDKILKTDGYIKEKMFSSPPDHQVIYGKADWLFFDLTIGDYSGPTKSPKELKFIAANMKAAADYIESHGKKPMFLIVPNKNSVYPEFMPGRFMGPPGENNLSLLKELMEQEGTPFVDAADILINSKQQDVYLHYDTHWNNIGARIVLNQLYKKLGIDFSYEITGYKTESTHQPDLYDIIHPGSGFLEEQQIYPDVGTFEYSGRFRTIDDMEIKTYNQNGNGEGMILYRDSFGRAIIPYIAQVFTNGEFYRATPYDLSMIEYSDCKYVVIEIVERNLDMLGDMVIPG